MPLLDLHYELLLSILDNLESERDINAFSRTSRRLHGVANTYLYRHNVQQSGSSGLCWAAQHGREAAVQRFLEEGADVQVDVKSRLPLCPLPLSSAVQNGHSAIVKLLLENGADADSRNGQNLAALLNAVQLDNNAIIKLLVEKGADVDAKDSNNRTALSWAANRGNEVAVKLLLENGADVHYSKGNETALTAAAEKNHVAVVKVLIEKGADVDLEHTFAGTPLSIAAKNGNEDVVNLLLKEGATVDLKSHWGMTPLEWAARFGRLAVVKLLVEKGAIVDPKGRQSALSCATWHSDMAVMKFLLKKGVEVDSREGIDGRTPLSFAAEINNVAAVKLLLKKGADMESTDIREGRTPLSYAAGHRCEDVVKLLLERGANVDFTGITDGRTPLSYAVQRGGMDIVKLLLEEGAKVDSKDIHGRTPLSYAGAARNRQMVTLLAEGQDRQSQLPRATGRGRQAVVGFVNWIQGTYATNYILKLGNLIIYDNSVINAINLPILIEFNSSVKMSVLGVPVDHRLRDITRKLMELNEAPSNSNASSDHIDRLRQLSECMRSRGWLISKDEVEFACYLAEPAAQGGIVVALMQPSPSQVYSIPVNDIIEDCNTLLALRDLAEFFSLPFDRLSIFDAFPFITKQGLDQNDINHTESHTTFHEMILEKQPRVILSGWKSQCFERFPTKSLQKLAIGAKFLSPTINYHGLTFSVVNMPHPSYYENYYPAESCFRQLQILEFAQACGLWWGVWEETAWMAELRQKCKARAKFLFDNRCDSDDEAFITGRLTQTLTLLGPLLSEMCYSFSSKAQIEDHLSKTNILELCSDASLILQRVDTITDDTKDMECAEASMDFICSWYHRRWPALEKFSVPVSAGVLGLYDHSYFDWVPVVDMPPLARQIELCLMDFAKKMNLTWTSIGDNTFDPNFEAQASAFFDLASSIENAMDEIPDNNRILRKPKDELANAGINVQMPTLVIKQKVKEKPTVSDNDIASDNLMKRLRELGI
ncbi:hypothetical protein V495_01245 [Pseudogymnoascus sp. VKM F-4514 (FW-929)]|nr:hypothetical protein V495_01245 [Pseudogymnoascus sp. VKM F-4514 (FW-929)]KFY54926.1 hypothetical protein V497_07336 [Pseudogymnoascus sp. VKM F-4516 (FW-969)]